MSSAGQALGGIVGGTIGFFTGGPTGALYGAQIGMGVGGLIDPPKGPVLNGPKLSDLSQQTAGYGVFLPRYYGTISGFGTVFWIENGRLKEVTRKESSGGKGGGGGQEVRTTSYYATFALALADVSKTGPIQGIRRIWTSTGLSYDAGSDDIETVIASNQSAKGWRLYTGAEDQMPDPRMEADLGVGNCPAYRGRAYIVFDDLALEKYSNSIAGVQVKIELLSQQNDLAPLLAQSVDSEVVRPSSSEMQIYRLGNDGIACGVAYNARVVGGIPQDHLAAIYTSGNLARYNQTVFAEPLRRLWMPAGQYMSAYPWHATGLYLIDRDASLTPPFDYWYNGTTYFNTGVFYNYILHWTVLGGFLYLHDYVADKLVKCDAQGRVAELSVPNDMRIAVVNGRIIGVSRVDIAESWIIDPSDLTVVSTAPCTINADIGTTAALLIGTDKPYLLRLGTNPGSPPTKPLYELSEDGAEIVHTYSLPNPTNTVAACVVDGVCTMADLYDPSGGGGLARGVRIRRHILRRVEPGMTTLADIVTKEVKQSRLLAEADIDVSLLTQPVRGYRIARQSSIRAALEPLQAAWPFDIAQRGYKIHFIPRGQASVMTIPAADLDARPAGAERNPLLPVAREMDTQIPRLVEVQFADVDREYDTNQTYDERTTVESAHKLTMELPIALSASEAAGMPEVLLRMYWLERRDIGPFRLPPSYRALEAGDVVTIDGGELGTLELRITQLQLLSDGRLECMAKLNDGSTYTPAAVAPDSTVAPPTLGLTGPSRYELLDIPLLTDEFNRPGWWGAMCGYTSGWPGGLLYRTPDGGQSWIDLQAWASPVTMGSCRAALPAGRTDIIDASSVLQVDLLTGDLSSISLESLYNGGNLLAVGAPGRWEIVAVASAEQQMDGSYILTDFLRGLFGTEWATGTHVAGDSVVALRDIDLAWIGMESSSIGQSRGYRGITSGRAIDSDTTRDLTYTGVNLKPLSPVRLNGHRHPSTRDWKLTALRRSRMSAGWRNGVGVPLGEENEAYELDIFSDNTFTTVVRTITSAALDVDYTSAQQVSDFGSNQATLYVQWHQMSAIVGRGFPLRASITRG